MTLRSLQRIFFSSFLVILTTVSVLQAQSIEHKVQNEETLFGIAQQYDVTVQQLKKWNDLKGTGINIGQVLVIKMPNKQSNPTHDEGTYTVKPDDSLFSIAQQFDVSVAQLKKWNDITGTTIAVGEVLVTRKKQTTQPPKVKKADDVTASQPKTITDGYYTVKSGDTLFRIAQLFGMEVKELKKLNDLTSNNISVGQQLKVIGGMDKSRLVSARKRTIIEYKLKQGMELKEALRIFEMDEQRFKQLNPDVKNDYINKGRVIKVTVPKAKVTAISNRGATSLTKLGEANVLRYQSSQKGTVTTNGELYNPHALTAAHASMAIGSVIFVKNPANGRGVIIRINDRITQKGLKLSKAARRALGITGGANVILYRINE